MSLIKGALKSPEFIASLREIAILSKEQNPNYLELSSKLLGAIGREPNISEFLSKKGTAIQEYIVNEVQEVYRLQGVKINDKHFEVVVRQMMRKVEVVDAGDTNLLENQLVNKYDFIEANDKIFDKKYIEDPGDSTNFQSGQLVGARQLR